MFILFSSKILLRVSTVLPDNANLFAGVLIWALATSLVTFSGYTFMNLAHVAAEVELDASFYATSRTINALRCDLVGVIHLAPFLRNLNAHLVVVLHRGDASLTGLAVDATASNHFIHNISIVIHNTLFAPGISLTNHVSTYEQMVVIILMNINLPKVPIQMPSVEYHQHCQAHLQIIQI